MTDPPHSFFSSEVSGCHVHMVGVCGIGMAGVAFLLVRRGFRVSGCDASRNRIAPWLEEAGVGVVSGHAIDHIAEDVSAVIRSAAIPDNSPEIEEARRRGIPVFLRGEVLPKFLGGRFSVAVSGTHGKTTTSTFITRILHGAGCDPAWCIGGEIEALGGVAGAGTGPIVVEADESDGTVALYAPDIAVVTNVEFDHMEHFENVDAFESCFRSLVQRTRGCVVFCGDDPRARLLSEGGKGTVSYGLGEGVDYQGEIVGQSSASTSFKIHHDGRCMVCVDLPVPGEHNVLNALAAGVVALRMGIGLEAVKRGLEDVSLPRRRYESLADAGGIRVISDYAHHPTEVAAVLSTTLRESCGRRLGVFQPHRYTRTKALGMDFPVAFSGLDQLILTPVYAASEQRLVGGTVWDLYANVRQDVSVELPGKGMVCVAENLEQAGRYLCRELRDGDLLLVIGAGDVESVGHEIAAKLTEGGGIINLPTLAADVQSFLPASEVVSDAPLGRRTTLGVGGTADLFVSVGDVEDLGRLLAYARETATPLRIMGGGSNILVSDLGVRGMVARLVGREFRSIRVEESQVVVGGGVSLKRLLEFLAGQGLGGLEFLEAVPGTVGGAAFMNAGAWGKSTCEQISWIRCLNADGGTCILAQSNLEYGYRTCRSLVGRVVIEVAFEVENRHAGGIRAERGDYARRRAWLKGFRSAGSVFRNPEGDYAGRLLEEAGAKEMGVGGATVTQSHANVVATGPGATASDVRALMMLMHDRVMDRFGCDLVPEMQVWI